MKVLRAVVLAIIATGVLHGSTATTARADPYAAASPDMGASAYAGDPGDPEFPPTE